MEGQAAVHPFDVGLLGADAAMCQADLAAYPVEQAWFRRGNVKGLESVRHGVSKSTVQKYSTSAASYTSNEVFKHVKRVCLVESIERSPHVRRQFPVHF